MVLKDQKLTSWNISGWHTPLHRQAWVHFMLEHYCELHPTVMYSLTLGDLEISQSESCYSKTVHLSF